MALNAEKKKLLMVGGLLTLLAVSFYINFMAGDDTPAPTAKGTSNVKPLASPKPGAASAQNGQSGSDGQPQITLVSGPLPVDTLDSRVQPNIGRNIFVYPPPPTPTPPPPPTPTPLPPPPPPITLVGLDPATVEARTADFTLTIAGAKIPPDARAYLNGREFKPTSLSDSQLRISVPAAMKAAPGTLRVEVRSASDTKLYSNPLNINIINPPTPAYRYIGLIVKGGVATAVLKPDTDEEVINIQKGQKLGNNWMILNITPQEMEILDTRNQVKHRLPFTNENQ